MLAMSTSVPFSPQHGIGLLTRVPFIRMHDWVSPGRDCAGWENMFWRGCGVASIYTVKTPGKRFLLEAVASNHYALVHWSVDLGFFPSYRTELNLALKLTGLCFELCSRWPTWRGLYSPTVLTPHFSTVFPSLPYLITTPRLSLSSALRRHFLHSTASTKKPRLLFPPSHLLTMRSGDQL